MRRLANNRLTQCGHTAFHSVHSDVISACSGARRRELTVATLPWQSFVMTPIR